MIVDAEICVQSNQIIIASTLKFRDKFTEVWNLCDLKQTSLPKRKYYQTQLQIYVLKCRSNTTAETAYNYFNDADEPWTWSIFQKLFYSQRGSNKTYNNNKPNNCIVSVPNILPRCSPNDTDYTRQSNNLVTSNRHPNGTLKSQSRTVEEPSDSHINQVITMGQKQGSSELDDNFLFYSSRINSQPQFKIKLSQRAAQDSCSLPAVKENQNSSSIFVSCLSNSLS